MKTQRDDSPQLGFTLIELMVVIVLVGIMAAMIVPEMKGTYENALLRSTSRKLVSAFNLASSRAVALSEVHRIQLDPRNGRYLVERPVHEGEAGSGFVPVRDVPGAEGQLDTRISIELRADDESSAETAREESGRSLAEEDAEKRQRREVISFYPDGTADAREVLLRDREGFWLGLRINPITARVHVVELGRQ